MGNPAAPHSIFVSQIQEKILIRSSLLTCSQCFFNSESKTNTICFIVSQILNLSCSKQLSKLQAGLIDQDTSSHCITFTNFEYSVHTYKSIVMKVNKSYQNLLNLLLNSKFMMIYMVNIPFLQVIIGIIKYCDQRSISSNQ